MIESARQRRSGLGLSVPSALECDLLRRETREDLNAAAILTYSDTGVQVDRQRVQLISVLGRDHFASSDQSFGPVPSFFSEVGEPYFTFNSDVIRSKLT